MAIFSLSFKSASVTSVLLSLKAILTTFQIASFAVSIFLEFSKVSFHFRGICTIICFSFQ